MTDVIIEREVLEEPKRFSSGAELVAFMDVNDILFHMTEKEAEVLLSYMTGHEYLLGELDGRLYRGDLCNGNGVTHWMEDSIDDAVNAAYEWNYDMIVDTREGMANPDNFIDYVNKKGRYDSLKEDEKVLDSMFERTVYGKSYMELSSRMESKVAEALQTEDGIDGIVRQISEAIAAETEKLKMELRELEVKTERMR